MSIITKAASVVVGAGLLTAVGMGTALAATPAATHQVTPAPAAAGGFIITNTTPTPMTLQSVIGDPSNDFQNLPAIGSTLAPGQSVHFDMLYRYDHNDADTVTYGNNLGDSFRVDLEMNGATGGMKPVKSSCTTTAGKDICTDPGAGGIVGDTITFVAPASTFTYDTSQPDQQKYWVDQLCAGGVAASCGFLPTGDLTTVQAPPHAAQGSFTNTSNAEGTFTVNATDTVDMSDTVDVGPWKNVGVTAPLELGIVGKFGHGLPTTHNYQTSEPVPIPAHSKAWLDNAPTMDRVTGDFVITLGNTTIDVTGLTFDFPDVNAPGNWELETQPTNGGPVHSTPLR